MDYQIVARRKADERDARLYPALGGKGSVIEIEELDGSSTHLVTALDLTVSQKVGNDLKPIVAFHSPRMEVMITDSRVTVACQQWFQGPAVRESPLLKPLAYKAMEALGDAAIARKQRGQALVGHVRYPWLTTVGYRPKLPRTGHRLMTEKKAWHASEFLRLGVKFKDQEGTISELYLILRFGDGISADKLAAEIAARAARYRLAHTKISDPGVRSRFQRLADGPPPTIPVPGSYTLYNMPHYFYISPFARLINAALDTTGGTALPVQEP